MTLVSDLLQASKGSQGLWRQKHAPMLEVVLARELVLCPALARRIGLTLTAPLERRLSLLIEAPRRDVLRLPIRSLEDVELLDRPSIPMEHVELRVLLQVK